MHYVDMSDTDYAGHCSSLSVFGRTSRERKGKSVALRRPPRGLTGGYARKSRKVAAAITTTAPQAPTTLSYAERLAKLGSVGKDYNEN
jgi:hypothetical protein